MALFSRDELEDRFGYYPTKFKRKLFGAIPYNFDEIIVSRLLNFLKGRYGYQFNISGDSIIKFNKWLETVDPKFKSRSRKISSHNSINSYVLDDQIMVVNLDVNTFMVVVVGKVFDKYSNRNNLIYLSSKGNNNDEKDDQQSSTTVYLFGKKMKKYYKQIIEELNAVPNDLVIYNVSPNKSSGRGRDDESESLESIVTELKYRDIDSLFYSDNTKQTVIDHIDKFFKNKDIYNEKSINFKTGILLYGEPGTGKSSLINALAVKYGLNIISVDINNFDRLDIPLLTSCINGDDLTYIVAIEDIDLVFNLSRQNVKTESGELDEEEVKDVENANVKTDKKDNAVIHKLLQFLDSNSSPSNVIFIATTNCVEKLDKAILREGRFDKKIHIGPINKMEATEMIKSFGCDDEQVKEILDSIPGDKVNQAKLQAKILSSIKDRLVKEDDAEIVIDEHDPEDDNTTEESSEYSYTSDIKKNIDNSEDEDDEENNDEDFMNYDPEEEYDEDDSEDEEEDNEDEEN